MYICIYILHMYMHTHTHMYIQCNMGRLRLVGSLKLQVFFAEYSFSYRALLQKRPIILGSLLNVANPYIEMSYQS